MPKTRKSELEVTPSGAAPAPVRRRATTPGTAAPRMGGTPRQRTASESITEQTPSAASVAEPLTAESALVKPTHEQIAALAYLYWVDRGYQGGSPEQDWLRAEQELCQSSAAAVAEA